MTIPNEIYLFRMVHWKNVEHILENGLYSRESPNANPNYINIGHSKLIDDRHLYPVKIQNGGHLGEYIPFYFWGHSPMLYMIMNGYQGVTKRPQEDIVYIVCPFEWIKNAQLEYVFTDMNAKIAVARYFREEKDFDKIRWNIIKDQYWKNDEHNIAKRDYKQAEFLIRDSVPVDCIAHLITKTAERKKYFEKMIQKLSLSIRVYEDKKCQLFY